MKMDTRVSPHMRALQAHVNGRRWAAATSAAGRSDTAGCNLTRVCNASAILTAGKVHGAMPVVTSMMAAVQHGLYEVA